MVECEHNLNGNCEIATHLANRVLMIPANDATCKACIAQDEPQAINKVTCGLTFVSLMSAKLWDRNQHSHITKCVAKAASKHDPGAALKKILADIGVHENVDCDCDAYATLMGSWGWQGCYDRKEEIIAHLNSQSISWFDMVKVAAAGYFTTRSLVDHALEISKPS